MVMKIVSYNVNGLRAAVKNGIEDWLKSTSPDVICLQETKLQPSQYPAEVFERLGYTAYLFSAEKKGYSGVAILTKIIPTHVEYGIGIEKYDIEGRFIRVDFGDISVVSAYHPSGTSGEERQEFKMLWLNDFHTYVNKLRKSHPNLILCGDYNIAHCEIDIHDPARNSKNSGFLPEERIWMTNFLSDGYIDTFRYLNTDTRKYSWWSYRFGARGNNKGWRIDYCIVNSTMRDMIVGASIDNSAVHSDHCPVVLEIKPRVINI